jgi:hypothetical protein
MEYRKKNLKPKPKIDGTLRQALTNEDFIYKIDFIGHLRKDMFLYQNDLNLKANKPCTITQEGLAAYLNMYF